MIILNMSNQL